ncbi:hypothetical protein KW844_14630 [Chitinophaga sp. sic0106]|nr:hypothetical protein [Chitinophaga sp. sic0106]
MTEKSTKVVAGYYNLSESEKLEVIAEIQKERGYSEQTRTFTRDDFNERTKRVTGPSSMSTCPCCKK